LVVAFAGYKPFRSPLQTASVLAHDRAMADRGSGRLVYSTDAGRICPGCGWPARDCKCSHTTSSESVPGRIVAKLRMEKKGRGGKTVTVVDGLPRNAAFLKDLSQELKRACGVGGAVQEGAIELQGDLRERVRELLSKKGFVIKG
jgi:translation initiation factor 1